MQKSLQLYRTECILLVTQIELFHLRLLLLSVKGATSFNDLKIVNGEIYQSFSAACLALGLIEDDDETSYERSC